MTGPFDQDPWQLRLEWGAAGVDQLAGASAVLVVVDVLSFSTAVSVAVSRGATVVPLPWRDARAAEAARSAGAVLAAARTAAPPPMPTRPSEPPQRAAPGSGQPPLDADGWSLSPSSLLSLPAGTRLALPSPNGATLSALAAGAGCQVLTGCLRNASAVAAAAATLAGSGAIAVVPAGERWPDEGAPLRPAVEDLIGAGAIIAGLQALGLGSASPEAVAAADVFHGARQRGLPATLARCSSGRELAAEGFEPDVALAAELDVHGTVATVPVLQDGEYRPATL